MFQLIKFVYFIAIFPLFIPNHIISFILFYDDKIDSFAVSSHHRSDYSTGTRTINLLKLNLSLSHNDHPTKS